jgi:hypothetical protein
MRKLEKKEARVTKKKKKKEYCERERKEGT